MNMTARDLWSRLDTDGIETSGFVRLRFSHVTACPMYAGRRIETGLECLILELEKEAIPAGATYPHTRGFAVSAESLDPGRSGRTRLLLQLVEERYRDVFASLAEDVLHHVAASSSAADAVKGMLSRLARWQTFLKQHDPEGLSVTERRGLFGELVMLQHLINLDLDPVSAVDAWRGPGASSHDFQLIGGSVEVKASAAVTPTEFRISNAKQLDDASVARLILALVLLDETESSGLSLPVLIAQIEAVLPEHVLPKWEETLTAAGYLRVQSDRYERPRYVVRSQRLYRVLDGFPRLLDSDLPSGVSQVSYTLAVAAIHQFECDERDLQALMEDHPGE